MKKRKNIRIKRINPIQTKQSHLQTKSKQLAHLEKIFNLRIIRITKKKYKRKLTIMA